LKNLRTVLVVEIYVYPLIIAKVALFVHAFGVARNQPWAFIPDLKDGAFSGLKEDVPSIVES
jgi:hypothetical protein